MKEIDEILTRKEMMNMALSQRKIMAINGKDAIAEKDIITWGFAGNEYPDPQSICPNELVMKYLKYLKKYYGNNDNNWNGDKYGHIKTNGLIQKHEIKLDNHEFEKIVKKIDDLLKPQQFINNYNYVETDFDDIDCHWD